MCARPGTITTFYTRAPAPPSATNKARSAIALCRANWLTLEPLGRSPPYRLRP
jgi:hypothetical protein